MRAPDPRWKPGRFGGQTPSQNMQLQIAAKPSVLCCHLVNINEKLVGLATEIPPFAKLLWCLFPSRLLHICVLLLCQLERIQKLVTVCEKCLEIISPKIHSGTRSVVTLAGDLMEGVCILTTA